MKSKIILLISIVPFFLGGVSCFLHYDMEITSWLLSLGIITLIIGVLHKLLDLKAFEKKYPLIYSFFYIVFIIFFTVYFPKIVENTLSG